jgi:hypothetical protein
VTGLFASFLLLPVRLYATRAVTDAPGAFDTERALTTNHLHEKGESWLPKVYVPAPNGNQTPSQLSEARSSNESKSQQWTTIAQSELCSKTELISGSMLSRSFASLPIFPIGKLTTTNASNAGQLSVPNNQLSITNTEPAERRVLFLRPQEDNWRAMQPARQPAKQNSLRESWWWKALSDFSTLNTFWQLGFASGVTWLSHILIRIPNFANQPIEYLAATGTIFFGTLFIAKGTVALSVWSTPKIKRWRNPPMLSVISHPGENVTLTLTHSGYPTTWQIRRRIVKVLYDGPNPDPAQRLCYLRRDGRVFEALLMKDGDMADVSLVSPYISEWHSRPWIIEVNYAGSSHGSQFDGQRGAIIEIEIKAVPPLKEGPTRLCYKVIRSNPHGDILVEDVPCEKFQVL